MASLWRWCSSGLGAMLPSCCPCWGSQFPMWTLLFRTWGSGTLLLRGQKLCTCLPPCLTPGLALLRPGHQGLRPCLGKHPFPPPLPASLQPHTPQFPSRTLKFRVTHLKESGWGLLTPPPGSVGTEPQVCSISHVPPPPRLREEGSRQVSCWGPQGSPPHILLAKAMGGQVGTYLGVEPASGGGTGRAQGLLPSWLPLASHRVCPPHPCPHSLQPPPGLHTGHPLGLYYLRTAQPSLVQPLPITR